MANNFSEEFNVELNGLNQLLGKLYGPDIEFTIEDLDRLEKRLINISTEIDSILRKVMETSKKARDENKLFNN